MDFIKHECGIAMVRLLKSKEHYEERYGDSYYGLHLLEKLLIREYNRGQDGAGIGCINIKDSERNVFQIKKEGSSAVERMAETIDNEIAFEREWGSNVNPFYGNLMLGHVRYSTTGKIGEEYLHPFIYTNEQNGESIMICGNFHLINSFALAANLQKEGITVDAECDTKVLLHDISRYVWKKEENRVSPIEDILEKVSPLWDGGFVICGISTMGDLWAVRDAHGIRPAFWYADEEKVIVASEKSAIEICAGVKPEEIYQIRPGVMLKVDIRGRLSFHRVIEEKTIRECVFERIYFSRADGNEITLERERLGSLLAQRLKNQMGIKETDTFFSFVPASARSSFMGIVAYFADLKLPVTPNMLIGASQKKNLPHILKNKAGNEVNFGRTIEKGKALRTFISTEKSREELVEKTYRKVIETLPAGMKRIAIVDDSIVRGTTLKSSVLSLLDSYDVDEIIVMSCSPQVRYPDFYGIDMSRLGELIVFRAAVELIRRKGKSEILDEIYRQCKLSLAGQQRTKNFVRLVYSNCTEEEISKEVSDMVTPEDCRAKVKVIFTTMDELRIAIPDHTGDWCFSGNYPTSGAYTKICQAYVNWYEGRNER